MKLLNLAFSTIYSHWLWERGQRQRVLRVLGWRTALVEGCGKRRYRVSPCFLWFQSLAILLASPAFAAQHAAGNYVVALVGNMSPDTVLRQHGLGASKKWTRAIHGFAATLNGNQADRLEQDTRVLYIEPDVTVNALAQTIPTGVRRIGCQSNALWLNSATTPIDVDVAILDTGIDLTHPDLNVYANTTFITGTTTGNDDHGHGTHVAGIAAAKNNTIGVVGVAPGARLWAVKVLNSAGSGSLSTLISGVDYVTQHAGEIEVANMSIGGLGSAESLRLAIQNSVALGVVYVVSAGNSHYEVYGGDRVLGTSDDTFPAAFPEVMTVSALCDSDGLSGGIGASININGTINPDDVVSSFSNYSQVVDSSNPVVSAGRAIDVAAPGVNIYSTYKGSTYATMSGTSMASPHVSGAVALYIAANARATTAAGVYAIRQALIDAGELQTAWGRTFQYPFTYLYDYFLEPGIAVGSAITGSRPVVKVTSPANGNAWFSSWASGTTLTFTATATDTEDGDVAANLSWYSSVSGVIGTGATFALAPAIGIHRVVAWVTDSHGNRGGYPFVFEIKSSAATAPTVAISAPADSSTVASTAVVTFTGTATDPVDGNIAARLAWSSSIDGFLGNGASFTNFLSANATPHVITANVTNAAGLSGSHSHSVTVTGTTPPQPPVNYPPIVTITQPVNGTSVPSGTVVACVASASDTEDGDLSANIVWSDNVSGGLGKGAAVTYTPAGGSHVITAQIADSAGATDTDTHTITVTSAGTPMTVTVAANKSAYVNKEKALLTTTVTSGGTAVSGATVTVTVRGSTRTVTTKTGTTTSAGTFAFYLPIQKSKFGTGATPYTGTVNSFASKTGSVSGTGATTFSVY